jgi:hypothetical protein
MAVQKLEEAANRHEHGEQFVGVGLLVRNVLCVIDVLS